MAAYLYYCGNEELCVNFVSVEQVLHRPMPARARGGGIAPRTEREFGLGIRNALKAQRTRLNTRFREISEARLRMQSAGTDTRLIATESIVLDGARTSEVTFARRKFGFEEAQDGRHGKVLLQAPGDAGDRVAMCFDVAATIHRRGIVACAHPNFLRAIRRPAGSRPVAAGNQWNLDNRGDPGVVGADVHALAAWTVTEGSRDVRVAVLDEGVDTGHPHLENVVVAEADFVDDNDHARPDGDDAHGTACAGIICGQSERARGLAPGVSLVAVRIAKSNASGFWIFDDFDTADAVDWSWDEAEADVLSNSWGGGPPVDVITHAFERAQTRGRSGRGAIIVIAAGNDQAEVDYPGNLATVLTVGASNQWDERKTRASRDGEHWWGSNFGETLDLLAPGVAIVTTDIRGSRGYSRRQITDSFNGTSAATPHVAAAAALMLSANPILREDRVRSIISGTADALSQSGWNRFEGHGRLNTYRALRQARRG